MGARERYLLILYRTMVLSSQPIKTMALHGDAFKVNLGDLPTWLAFVAAAVAAYFVYGQLKGQRAEIARQTRLLERQQADQIDVSLHTDDAVPPASPQAKNEPNWTVYITNGSRRPIRDIMATIVPAPGMDSAAATQRADIVTVTVRDSKVPEASAHASTLLKINVEAIALLRAGAIAGLVFQYRLKEYPKPRFAVEFTDDAGLRWQIDSDLHLQRIPEKHLTWTWTGALKPPDH
jgi:hypothetical protein